MKISAPCHLEGQHNLEPFSCGAMVLDDWLKTRSLKNEASGASRTYVITRANDVVGQPYARAGQNSSQYA